MWAPAAVLLLTGITYYSIKHKAYRSTVTLKTQTENTSIPPTAPSTAAGGASGHAAASPESSVITPDQARGPETSVQNKAASGLPADHDAAASNYEPDASGTRSSSLHPKAGNLFKASSGPASAMPGKGAKPSNESMKKTGRSGNRNPAVLPGDEDRNDASAGSPGAKAEYMASVHLPALAGLSTRPLVRGNDAALNRFAADHAEKPAPSRSLRIDQSLTIGIVTGPDYTEVSGITNNQLSNNIGISIGYYLTGRLSLNTGLQYTTKYYWADGRSFQPQMPPSNPALSPYAAFPRIETVNGSCSLFEIPLTLRYDFVQHGRTKAFVNAGLSSYLVRKQVYTYFFHNGGRPYEWRSENRDHLSYWFAFGDLSGGIEQALGKGFSFQAEPFIRLPLRSIGTGDMKMNSFGILFSIRYAPMLGKIRK
jgi:hypothetical protein